MDRLWNGLPCSWIICHLSSFYIITVLQVLRSVGQWSAGIATKDNSILQAILHSIDFSEHFIYMEVLYYSIWLYVRAFTLFVLHTIFQKRSSFSYHIYLTKGFVILLLKLYVKE